MRGSRSVVAFLPLVFLCSGCALRPKITRWHNELHVARGDDSLQNELDFGVFGFDPAAAAGKSFRVTDLTERGQAAFILALSKITPDPATLIAALGKPIKPPATPPGDIDVSKTERRLVFSVAYLPIHPADRLQMLSMRLLPKDNNVQFVDWTELTTKYETVNLGTLTYDHKVVTDASAGLGPNVVKELATPKLDVNATRDLSEKLDLNLKYASVTGRLAPNEIVIFEKAAPNVDISGMVTADVTLQLPKAPPVTVTDFSDLFENDKPKDPTSIKTEDHLMDLPRSRAPVLGCAVLTAWVRRVCGGGTTISESDDCATLIPIVRTADVVIGPAVNTAPYIVTSKDESTRLGVEGRPLVFRDPDSAREFLRYVVAESPPDFGKTALTIDHRALTMWNGSATVRVLPSDLQVRPYFPAMVQAPGAPKCAAVLLDQNKAQRTPNSYQMYLKELQENNKTQLNLHSVPMSPGSGDGKSSKKNQPPVREDK